MVISLLTNLHGGCADPEGISAIKMSFLWVNLSSQQQRLDTALKFEVYTVKSSNIAGPLTLCMAHVNELYNIT